MEILLVVTVARFTQGLVCYTSDELVYILENELGILGIDGVLAYFSCAVIVKPLPGFKKVAHHGTNATKII